MGITIDCESGEFVCSESKYVTIEIEGTRYVIQPGPQLGTLHVRVSAFGDSVSMGITPRMSNVIELFARKE